MRKPKPNITVVLHSTLETCKPAVHEINAFYYMHQVNKRLTCISVRFKRQLIVPRRDERQQEAAPTTPTILS